MKLDTLIQVGFCLSYGDADYRVSMAVGDLPRKRFNELKLAMLGAVSQADQIWLQTNRPEATQAGSPAEQDT